MTSLLAAGVFAFFLAALLGELVLASLLWKHTRRDLAGRFIVAYLVLHALALAPATLQALLSVVDWFDIKDSGTTGRLTLAWMIIGLGFLPALDIAFALSYPRLPQGLRRDRSWLFLPFLVPSLAAAWGAVFYLGQEFAPPQGVAFGPWTLHLAASRDVEEVLIAADVLYFVAMIGIVTIVLRRRASHASTEFERQRILFMLKFVTIPMAAALLAVVSMPLLYMLTAPTAAPGAVAIATLVLGAAGIVLIPALGWGYGILRYRILDLDRRLRGTAQFTLNGGFIALLFVLVFFALSETAENFLADATQSRFIGLGGAALLAIGIHPIERATRRLARRLVPDRARSRAEQAQQRREAYRAQFEDLAPLGTLGWEDRRRLDQAAERLGLTPAEVRVIEASIEKERGAPRAGTREPKHRTASPEAEKRRRGTRRRS